MDKQYEYRSKLVSLEKPKKVSLLKLLFSFKGRIAKGQFLLAFLPLTLLPFVFFDFDNPELFLVIALIFLWPTFSIQAKRDHDLGKSG